MKIVLVNGSPKPKRSNSGYILDQLDKNLSDKNTVIRTDWNDFNTGVLSNCDALIFAFPLYVDSIPSNLLEALEKSEASINKGNHDLKVYAIINNAFYEANQDKFAAQMINHWCDHTMLNFGGAVCFGAGPLLQNAYSLTGDKDNDNAAKALNKLIDIINNEQTLTETLYIEPDCSKEAYQKSANSNWFKAAEKRGLTEDDLRCKRY